MQLMHIKQSCKLADPVVTMVKPGQGLEGHMITAMCNAVIAYAACTSNYQQSPPPPPHSMLINQNRGPFMHPSHVRKG